MDLRPLRPDDLPALGAIAQRAFVYDPLDEALVREKSIGAPDWDPELGIVAHDEEGAPVGFIAGCLGARGPETRGWVRLLAVEPSRQRRGVGSALLQALEPRLAERGARSVGVFDGPLYLTPGIDFRNTAAYCFLEKRGYQVKAVRKSLRCALGPEPFEVEPGRRAFARNGVEVRRATAADAGAIDRWLGRLFPGWRFEVAQCLRNDPPTYHGAWRGGAPIGFAAYHGMNKTWPHFGPMGVEPGQRRAGLGRLLLHLCLNDLLGLGWDWAIIPWVGPIPFYHKACGAVIDRVFWSFEKGL